MDWYGRSIHQLSLQGYSNESGGDTHMLVCVNSGCDWRGVAGDEGSAGMGLKPLFSPNRPQQRYKLEELHLINKEIEKWVRNVLFFWRGGGEH